MTHNSFVFWTKYVLAHWFYFLGTTISSFLLIYLSCSQNVTNHMGVLFIFTSSFSRFFWYLNSAHFQMMNFLFLWIRHCISLRCSIVIQLFYILRSGNIDHIKHEGVFKFLSGSSNFNYRQELVRSIMNLILICLMASCKYYSLIGLVELAQNTVRFNLISRWFIKILCIWKSVSFHSYHN